MTGIVLNADKDISDIIELKKEGYGLLSICYLGGNNETVQYSLINHKKPMIQHFTIDTIGKTLVSIDNVYSNAKIFEFEVNQSHFRQIIENDVVANKWSISNNSNSENYNFNFSISEELVEHVNINLGFSYRSIERKLMTYNLDKISNVLAKICGLCSTSHSLAYCLLVERMMEITNEITEDSSLLRVMFTEIERIENHLLWLGLTTFSIGLKSIAMKALDLRNRIEQILNKIKISPTLIIIGGIYANFDGISILSKSIDDLENSFLKMKEDKDYNQYAQYTCGVAVLPYASNMDLRGLGPIARSIGALADARADFPYSGFKYLKYTPICHSEGDLNSIFTVKWREISASFELIREILDNISQNEIKPCFTKEIEESELFHSYVEAPNGLLQYTGRIHNGKLDQLHINVPTIINVVPMVSRLIGSKLQYVPLILRGIDMGYDPNDVLIFHDIQKKKVKGITGFNLQKKATQALQKTKLLNFKDL